MMSRWQEEVIWFCTGSRYLKMSLFPTAEAFKNIGSKWFNYKIRRENFGDRQIKFWLYNITEIKVT